MDELNTTTEEMDGMNAAAEASTDTKEVLSGSFRHLCPSARYPFPYGFLCIVCAEGFKAGEAFLSGGAA